MGGRQLKREAVGEGGNWGGRQLGMEVVREEAIEEGSSWGGRQYC